MKELYQQPDVEVIHFEEVDIITTSGQLEDDELPELPLG
jgi:hypothetical protein